MGEAVPSIMTQIYSWVSQIEVAFLKPLITSEFLEMFNPFKVSMVIETKSLIFQKNVLARFHGQGSTASKLHYLFEEIVMNNYYVPRISWPPFHQLWKNERLS